MVDATAQSVVATFVATWVSRRGVPTDCGMRFCSATFSHLLQLLSTVHITSATYHSSSNGLVEHHPCTIKSALTAHGDPTLWLERLSIALERR